MLETIVARPVSESNGGGREDRGPAAATERLKALVLDSPPSPESRRAYSRTPAGFLGRCQRQRASGFTKATVNAYPAELELQGCRCPHEPRALGHPQARSGGGVQRPDAAATGGRHRAVERSDVPGHTDGHVANARASLAHPRGLRPGPPHAPVPWKQTSVSTSTKSAGHLV